MWKLTLGYGNGKTKSEKACGWHFHSHSKSSIMVNNILRWSVVGCAYQGKGIVFKFIIEYSSLRDFGP